MRTRRRTAAAAGRAAVDQVVQAELAKEGLTLADIDQSVYLERFERARQRWYPESVR